MRRSTFAVVSAIIFGIVGHTFHSWLNTYDLDSRIYLGIWLGAGTIVGSVLESILARFNTKLLAYRKAHGRDIEDEERYESELVDHGMISLHLLKDHEDDELERQTGISDRSVERHW